MFRILCGPKKKRLNSASLHRRPELEYGKHDRKSALLIVTKRTLSRLKIIDQAHLTSSAPLKKNQQKSDSGVDE